MSATPAFATVPHTASVNVSTANTNRDGTGVVATLLTAPVATTNGTRVDDIAIKARVATTAGMIRFFLYDGTTHRFLTEVPVSAITPSASVAAFEDRTTLKNLGWIVQGGWSLRCSTEKGESFDVSVTNSGDFA